MMRNPIISSRLDERWPVVNQLPALWAQADQEGKREVLEAVFERFVVGGKRVVDTEVRAPYSWLTKLDFIFTPSFSNDIFEKVMFHLSEGP